MNRYQRFYKTWSEADEDAGQFEVVMYSPENGWYLHPDWARINDYMNLTRSIDRKVTWTFYFIASVSTLAFMIYLYGA